MLRGRDIVCISSIDWDFIWQGHQEIMATLAGQGNRVLFVENTGVRPPTFRDLSRLKHRLLNWWKSARGFREERENLFVYSPLVLPFPYSRLARVLNRVVLLRALRRWMRVMDMSRPIVWTFLPTPLTLDLVAGIDPEVTVYYCIDSFAESSYYARRIKKSERETLRRADLVFVTSSRLREHALAGSGIGHVAYEIGAIAAFRGIAQRRLAARHQQDARPLVAEQLGGASPDAATCSRDDTDFPLQAQVHGRISV